MKYYVADAFTDHVFGGGAAGVLITEEFLPDETMQCIAMENNLADIAFAVDRGDHYDLRWFMPQAEINLNGHATLAAAYIIFHHYRPDAHLLTFHTKGGVLTVQQAGEWLELDFPSIPLTPIPLTGEMTAALGDTPAETFLGEQLVFVYDSAEKVQALTPDFAFMRTLPQGQGCFVTARNDTARPCDIVARAFWPKMGVDEDPVCGNMHCHLTPFWAERLQKPELVSHQLSQRGAVIRCRSVGDRVKLIGQAALFLEGEIFVGAD